MQSRHTQPAVSERPNAKTGSRPTAARRAPEQQNEKKVELALNVPTARQVKIAGTFNNWDANKTLMQKTSEGVWKTSLSLPPGRYEYRFVVDGEWRNDPNRAESVPNPFGGTNSVITI